MSNSARSIFCFGIYLGILGLFLMLAPASLLSLGRNLISQGCGTQIIGLLLALMAYYYLMAAHREMTFFFQWTVFARGAITCFLLLLVFYQAADPILLLFGFIELVGAAWTQLSLRSSKIAMASNKKVIILAFKRHCRFARKADMLPPPQGIAPRNIPTQ